MSRSSASVWKKSFAQVANMPECPKNLSLPAWANLVYGHHCHVCKATLTCQLSLMRPFRAVWNLGGGR